ncbi:hypothetical protein ES692_12615 [Psychroserpens burtonensis]|uniref:Uncharacterized protein n=2 Tax=Psychroserpens burtonensis TaxID=49278 RepID=A0A5C7B6V9_9FLAO|nr:hypothetical protein [Psychroserpens burtonensis]TXE16369.1 hypothetical protein ES692_12615 [Psychroserpens burtonensis]
MLYATEKVINNADATFIVQQIQHFLNGRIELKSGNKSRKDLKKEFKARAIKLKTKTLLLDEQLITSNLKKKIKTIYPYEYKIVSKEIIDKAIIEKIENIAYIRPIPAIQITNTSGSEKVSKQLYLQYVINSLNGEVLTYIAPGISIGMSGDGNGQTSHSDIN